MQSTWIPLGHIFPHVSNWDTKNSMSHCGKQHAELLFEVFSQRYERGSILVTTNLPFDEWTEVFGSERLTGALLDRLTHHVHILEMNGESYRLKGSRQSVAAPSSAPDRADAV